MDAIERTSFEAKERLFRMMMSGKITVARYYKYLSDIRAIAEISKGVIK